jgi:hypothetical protein
MRAIAGPQVQEHPFTQRDGLKIRSMDDSVKRLPHELYNR